MSLQKCDQIRDAIVIKYLYTSCQSRNLIGRMKSGKVLFVLFLCSGTGGRWRGVATGGSMIFRSSRSRASHERAPARPSISPGKVNADVSRARRPDGHRLDFRNPLILSSNQLHDGSVRIPAIGTPRRPTATLIHWI